VSTGVGVPVPTGRLQILAATRPRNEASCWTTTATKTQCRQLLWSFREYGGDRHPL